MSLPTPIDPIPTLIGFGHNDQFKPFLNHNMKVGLLAFFGPMLFTSDCPHIKWVVRLNNCPPTQLMFVGLANGWKTYIINPRIFSHWTEQHIRIRLSFHFHCFNSKFPRQTFFKLCSHRNAQRLACPL